jgi:hypothetical protein
MDRHRVRLLDAFLEWMSIVEPATNCRCVYIRSCCLEESISVVIERAAGTILLEKRQDGFVRNRESTSTHTVKAAPRLSI